MKNYITVRNTYKPKPVYNNNANIIDAVYFDIRVETNTINPDDGKPYRQYINVEMSTGYNWEECKDIPDDMSISIIHERYVREWAEGIGIDFNEYLTLLLKTLKGMYLSDQSKYKKYFWNVEEYVAFDSHDF